MANYQSIYSGSQIDSAVGKALATNPIEKINNKTGQEVTLTAGDIYATNSQSIQTNLERIDERIDDLPTQVVVTAAENKTVNGYVVPKLTDSNIVSIYNGIVKGSNVVIIDATETMFFTDINADVVSGDLFISFRYFTSMILEYGEGDVTNYVELGGGGGGQPRQQTVAS